jgi:type IV secretory pathway TraG/TraD family ATPase VirD4
LVVAVHRRVRALDAGEGARMARTGELRALQSRRAPVGARLALGYQRRRLVWCEPRHSAVGFGPTQSWKSTGLEIPNILEWPGCVIASSAKVDLIRDTIGRRRELGRVWVFDPFGLSGERSHTWSPIGSCSTWDAAKRQARRLTWAAQLDSRVEGGDARFWDALARQYLAPLLLAGNRAGRDVRVLLRWTASDREDAVRQALRTDPATGAEREPTGGCCRRRSGGRVGSRSPPGSRSNTWRWSWQTDGHADPRRRPLAGDAIDG